MSKKRACNNNVNETSVSLQLQSPSTVQVPIGHNNTSWHAIPNMISYVADFFRHIDMSRVLRLVNSSWNKACPQSTLCWQHIVLPRIPRLTTAAEFKIEESKMNDMLPWFPFVIRRHQFVKSLDYMNLNNHQVRINLEDFSNFGRLERLSLRNLLLTPESLFHVSVGLAPSLRIFECTRCTILSTVDAGTGVNVMHQG